MTSCLGHLKKIRPRKQPSSDGALVHNLSSHRLTQQQLAILSYDAKFNMKDARPEDFIASFESALQKCDAVEECKNAMRQQVVNLLLQHQQPPSITMKLETSSIPVPNELDNLTGRAQSELEFGHFLNLFSELDHPRQ
ncbi:unnamed protein product [Schistocephalus solidus]|uniref:Uncharacterized protein n=1 Tax=Schistocephalus solidus TaxID=70667 RepID=A0A183SBF3_SCHSO|nr:unnamed protein product [Schistocephalus solidus]